MQIENGNLVIDLALFIILTTFLISFLVAFIYFLLTREKSLDQLGKTGKNLFIAGPYDQLLLTKALAATRNGIVITDRTGTIVYCNESFCRISGYPEKEILGKNPRNLVKSGVHGEEFYRELWKTITSGKHWHGEIINRRKDGSLYNEEQVITPVKDTTGQITNFIAIKQDITHRKQLEKDLRLSEEKFRNIFIHHNAIMMLVDPVSGLIIDANTSAEQFYGFSRQELTSMYIQNINQLDDEQIEIERKKASSNQRNYFIFPHKLKDGRIRIVEVHSAPISVNNEKLLFSIIHDVTERQELEEKLRKIAITDDLTELVNRRQLMKIGEIEFKRAERHTQPLCVIMIDVDHFKEINDEKGHSAGDYALREIATCIKSGLREYDTAGRLGGEEFTVILPNTSSEEGQIVAERIRKLIEGCLFSWENLSFRCTASLGIADTLTDTFSDFEKLLQAADAALYDAKDAGRNRVIVQKRFSKGV